MRVLLILFCILLVKGEEGTKIRTKIFKYRSETIDSLFNNNQYIIEVILNETEKEKEKEETEITIIIHVGNNDELTAFSFSCSVKNIPITRNIVHEHKNLQFIPNVGCEKLSEIPREKWDKIYTNIWNILRIPKNIKYEIKDMTIDLSFSVLWFQMDIPFFRII